eukprot:jgi/Botrbrau1/7626/Bobra.0159s0074.1
MAGALAKSRRLKGVNTSGIRLRLVDAKEQVLGRLASQISTILQGKDKPTFSNHEDNGDVVIVKNARHISLTGRKWDQKVYKWHSGYPGGLKERSVKDEFARDPGSILYRAVYGMLPKNRLRDDRARKLRLFPDEDNPFEKDPRVVPWEPPPRKLRIKERLFELPAGFDPMNRDAYRRRFAHRLPTSTVEQLRQVPPPVRIDAGSKP